MSVKLRRIVASMLAVIVVSLSACDADPLTPQENARLQRIFGDMHDVRAAGVIQNLRFAGLYEGDLSLNWSPALAQAVNQAHFDLDFVDEHYDLSTDGGAAAFLQDLSSSSIRPRLASELSVEPPSFVQISPVAAEASKEGRTCSIDGGSYSRNGERIHLIFYEIGGQAGIKLAWDGWPSSIFPRLLPVHFGDAPLPMMVEYVASPPAIDADVFNVNASWVTDAMKRADEIEIGPESEIAPLKLPTGDLYQAALALERCSA